MQSEIFKNFHQVEKKNLLLSSLHKKKFNFFSFTAFIISSLLFASLPLRPKTLLLAPHQRSTNAVN